MRRLVVDCEVYKDYFLVATLDVETGAVRCFEMFPSFPDSPAGDFPALAFREHIRGATLITFNGNGYDIPMISLAAEHGASCAEIKKTSDKIIVQKIKPWQMEIEPIEVDHIDLIEVAPGIAGLKIYGGRMHCPTMQDLPIEPSASIDPEQRDLLREYCTNDLRVTKMLYEALLPQIELRKRMSATYELDLRSKSDAQIAEAVIRSGVERAIGKRLPKTEYEPGQTFKYTVPSWVNFLTPKLNEILDTVAKAVFVVSGTGVVLMPDEIGSLAITIGQSTYTMGIGGLHSTEKVISHYSDDENTLFDRDVASYYPSIILQCGLQPEHMGDAFTKVYRGIVEQRLAAKKSGDKVTADSLKITINGSFGKFGSPYSVLYSPKLLIQTTVTGQLALLMLIERLEECGIPVVSANTDGIVIKCPNDQMHVMDSLVWLWEDMTGFVTEETCYRSLHSRDVNNYFAIKPDGGVKIKGVYAPAGLAKNPANEVCISAVVRYLTNNVPVAETIRSCGDVRKFVSVRKVNGGAVHGKQYLGSSIRWYYAKGAQGAIHYKSNGNKVPRTEGSSPLMTLPVGLPDDIDFDWYIAEANSILKDIAA